MNTISERDLMQLASVSRVVAVDASDSATAAVTTVTGHAPLALAEMLELRLETLLGHFRRK
jgi:hypothetical protein